MRYEWTTEGYKHRAACMRDSIGSSFGMGIAVTHCRLGSWIVQSSSSYRSLYLMSYAFRCQKVHHSMTNPELPVIHVLISPFERDVLSIVGVAMSPDMSTLIDQRNFPLLTAQPLLVLSHYLRIASHGHAEMLKRLRHVCHASMTTKRHSRADIYHSRRPGNSMSHSAALHYLGKALRQHV